MKRPFVLVPALVLAAFLAVWAPGLPPAAQAQRGGPNIKESVNYFMNYFNESVVQLIRIQELTSSGALDRDALFFYFDLTTRIEKTLGLVFNLRDLYFLYGRTTYCFTKDEKRYLLDRIQNITEAIGKIRDMPYLAPLSEDIAAKPAETAAKGGDATSKGGDATSKTVDGASKISDGMSKGGDGASKNGDGAVKIVDSPSKSGDGSAKLVEGSLAPGDPAVSPVLDKRLASRQEFDTRVTRLLAFVAKSLVIFD